MRSSDLLSAVMARTGVARAEAQRAVAAVLSVLAERLVAADRAALAAWLGGELGATVGDVRTFVQYGVEGFHERVTRRLGGTHGAALELTQVICAALGERLDAELATRLERHLPQPIAQLLVPAARAPALVARHPVPHGRSLAGGRPGSNHPLSLAAPAAGHGDSVAVAAEPHARRKLSTVHDDGGSSLAEGRPGATRPLHDLDR